jgi:hypothetical protein
MRILTFLKANYGTITSDDLGTNQEKLMAPWDPNTPIQTVFTTGEACRHFAKAGGEPISDGTYMRYLLQKFQSSGVFAKAVTDWKDKAETDKTVDNFMAHFLKANRNRKTDDKSLKDTLKANTAILNGTDKGVGPTKTCRYCWSHGICNHTSAHCTNPVKGHVKTATLADLMQHGGSTFILRPLKFKSKYPAKKRDKDKENKPTPGPTASA